MKKFSTLLMAAGMTLAASAQTITVSSVDPTLANDYAEGCEIDLNNDGLKELIISGQPNWDAAGKTILLDADGNEYEVDRKSWILSWNGSAYDRKEYGTAAEKLFGIRGSVLPADFNGDGNVDLFISGEAYDFTGVYLNDGQGNLTKDPTYAVLDQEGNQVDWYPRSADVADFNADGLPDLVTIGWSGVAGIRQANCGVLINLGDGTFQNRLETGVIGDGEVDFEFALCTVKAFDLNNDGFADFAFLGNIDNGDRAFTKAGRAVPRTFMTMINMGAQDDGSVAFYDLELGTSVSYQFGRGNLAVADFNCDGTPDIFVTGEAPGDSPSTAEWGYYPQLLTGKISGAENDITFTDLTSFVARGKDCRPLNENNVGVRAIDYNADGYYDLFYLGWCEQMLDGSGNTQAGWFIPGSAAGLISYQRMPGASEQGIFFLDYGVEGALNYTFTGYHGDAAYFQEGTEFPGGRSMVFTKNPWQIAARPDAPTAPKAEVNGNSVTFSWTPAATSLKNVTYELYIRDVKTGRIYNGCTSFVGGDKDGIRKVLREGNAFMNTTLTLTLPDGAYEWGVQTVNAALRGSAFANGETVKIGDQSAIASVRSNAAATTIYSLDGRQMPAAQRGINIVRTANGFQKVVK